MNGKGGFLSPYMGGQNYEPPTDLIKLAYPPSVAFSKAVSLARLVKAEIVSPYSGILINTGVGNPTAPLTTALGG